MTLRQRFGARSPDRTPEDLVRLALAQWQDTCPGAGFEHHNEQALRSLLATPAMDELVTLARRDRR